MMLKRAITILPLFWAGTFLFSQSASIDTTTKQVKTLQAADTTIDYDLLFQDMESFLDSIYTPRSFFMGNLAIGKGFYNLAGKSDLFLTTTEKFTYTPTVGYFHRGGLSITGTANIVDDDKKLNVYQFSLSPGYDYLKNRNFATGITYTRFFTKDSLPFYTTPLQNELYTYFIYRKWWLKPSLAMSYGWGSRSDYMEREAQIQDLRLRRRGLIRINSKESISDFSLIASVRHDFYWLSVFSFKDHFRVTPQLSFVSGTQKFGFNQSANTYATLVRTGANVLYNSENVYLDDQLEFQPLSLTMFLRGEYSIGKFFIQPQLIMDYYFPSSDKNYNTLFFLNLGCIF